MFNFFNLLKNEKIKIFNKKTIIIFILILFLSEFINYGYTFISNTANEMLEDNNRFKENIKSEISLYKQNKDSASKAKVEYYQFAVDNHINIDLYGYWKTDAIESLILLKTDIYKASNAEIDYTNQQLDIINKKIEFLTKILKDNDYSKYIDFKIANIEEQYKNKEITLNSKDTNIDMLNFNKKYEIGKDYNSSDYWKKRVSDDTIILKVSLANGIDEKGKALSLEQKQYIKDKIAINIYKIENDIENFSKLNGKNNRINFEINAEEIVMGFISVFFLIISGGIVSQEFTKGTIKLLFINPNKRWKILLSKIILCIGVLILATIIMAFVTYLLGSLIYPSFNVYPELYISNGIIDSIPHIIYLIIRFLLIDVNIIIYMLFTIMISTLTRNTATAVGLGIFTYMISSTVTTLLNLFIKYEWIKYIPFNNMNLIDKIFKNGDVINGVAGTSTNIILNTIDLKFSLCVLGVCIMLMLITTFESFNKKDIV